MEQLIDKTLSQIKSQSVKPLPKSFFAVKRYLWTLALAISLILAGLSVAMFYLEYISLDYEMIDKASLVPMSWLALALPWAWLVLFVILSSLAYLEFRKSRFGYRWSTVYLIFGIVLGVLLISIILSCGHWQERTSERLSEYPVYNIVFSPRAQVWQNPNDCLLAGRLMTQRDGVIEIKDIEGRLWELTLTPETILPTKLQLKSGKMLKIICKKIGDKYVIEEIRAWNGPDRGQRKLHR
jgi:hypothetical protein